MPVEKMEGGGFIVTGDAISAFRLLALKGALHLETLGMHRSRGVRWSEENTAFAIVKKEFGFKGSKASVYEQFVKALKAQGILKGEK